MGDNTKDFERAVELIQGFVARVEEGSIRSKRTYAAYREFLVSIGRYPCPENAAIKMRGNAQEPGKDGGRA